MIELKGDATKNRIFAMMIDNILASILCVLVAAKLPGELPSAVRWVIAGFGYLAYFFFPEAIWGSSPGKRAFGLQVARLDGGRAGWSEAVWRTLLRIVEVNPLLAGAIPGGLAVMWSKRKQRLGDMLARTAVVKRNVLVASDAARA
jgi:uncharacterized RDD family membrane protein YckC